MSDVVNSKLFFGWWGFFKRLKYMYIKVWIHCLQIVDNTRLHIIPTLNPDGLQMSEAGQCNSDKGHTNSNDRDLDKTFFG